MQFYNQILYSGQKLEAGKSILIFDILELFKILY